MKKFINNKIRQVLAEINGLHIDAHQIDNSENLFNSGLSSVATVQLLLGIEDSFNIEIPDQFLNRKSFSSICEIENTIQSVLVETGNTE